MESRDWPDIEIYCDCTMGGTRMLLAQARDDDAEYECPVCGKVKTARRIRDAKETPGSQEP